MPSKIDKMRLTREHDRRYKLSEEQIAEARRLYADGVNGPELSRRYGVSVQCIYYNVSDTYRERALAAMKEHNLVRPPRDRDKRSSYMRELRNYKKNLFGAEVVNDGPMGR